MKIFHYRKSDYNVDPWENGLITSDTQLDSFNAKAIISINRQTVIKQHASTYLTGRDTCHAHHFAKMIATALLKGNYENAPSLTVNTPKPGQDAVLWIDSIRGIHACTEFFKEMTADFANNHKRFSMLCLDKLGSFRYDFYALIYQIECAIQEANPSLIVIDDIDHLMPYCGINVADAFTHAVRDTLNHSSAACLFIGYNHLNKRASTTGNLGKFLFSAADNIFSITTQNAISRVKLVKSYTIHSDVNDEFLFDIGNDNLPHQVVKAIIDDNGNNFIKKNTLRDIIGQVIQPGQTISPDELYQQLNNRRQQLNRQDRTRTLIAQAAQLGIIKKTDHTNDYTLTPDTPNTPKSPEVPNPPVPPGDDRSVYSDAIAVPHDTPKAPAIPEGCVSSTSHATGVNNSLTLPPHPPVLPVTPVPPVTPVLPVTPAPPVPPVKSTPAPVP